MANRPNRPTGDPSAHPSHVDEPEGATVHLVAALAAAACAGLLAQHWNVPGGAILGAMVGAAAVTLWRNVEVQVPAAAQTAALIIIGAALGMQLTRPAMLGVLSALGPALLSAVIIIACGVGITLLLRALGIAPAEDLLATSPGALSVIGGIAVERGNGAAEVATFHLVRIVLVVLSLPLLLGLFGGK
ncbi:MAG: AbrB family transcriptional regulator [Carbonactinosporaceae bacterium]